MPVVDSENHMLGIIKAERLLQGVQEDSTKDIQRMFGAGGDERVFSTMIFSPVFLPSNLEGISLGGKAIGFSYNARTAITLSQ